MVLILVSNFKISLFLELKMIYETAIVESTNVMNHLWIYRPQISVDHVAQSLQQNEKAELRVLKEFLKKVIKISVG